MTFSPSRRITDAVRHLARTYALGLALVLSAMLGAPLSAHATLNNGENAVSVLGQDDGTFAGNLSYTKPGPNDSPNALGFSSPHGTALDSTNHRLFITDTTNNRVLVFNLNSSNQLTGMLASNVIGQPDFRTNAAFNGLSAPEGLAFDATNNRLFVADSSDNRVMVYNTSTITNGMGASYVLGQANFSNKATACSQAGMNGPNGVALDAADNLLYVTEGGNNRVTAFNVAPGSIASGENASYVLGQADFSTTCAANQGGSASQSSTNNPQGGVFDSANNRLFVVDSGNNRVMVFATSSISNGMNASYELGQPSGVNAFTTFGTATTQSGMNAPRGAEMDTTNQRLFTTEITNNRTMVWNVDPASIANGENASYVLGQPNFTTGSAGTTQAKTSGLQGNPAYDDGNHLLYVPDSANNRVMVFNVATGSIASGENASNELGQDDGTFAGNVVYTKRGANDGPNALGFAAPEDIQLDAVNHRLFVSDFSNSRVLVFNLNTDNSLPGGLSGMLAANVIGQADFRTAAGVVAQSRMSGPVGISFDAANNRLFVADNGNHRVLVYSTSTITNGMNASYELGQASGASAFTLHATACSQAGMNGPNGVALDAADNLLYVTEGGNNRVTAFNVATGSIANGENASYVLGQVDFSTTCAANQGGSASQSSLSAPRGGDFDATNYRLFVTDASNNRVMVFNTSAISNGENASYVLGQANFTSTGAHLTQAGFSAPQGISYDPNNSRLFVGDNNSLYNRVTVFHVDPGTIANGENASNVIGQANFTTGTIATTQSGLHDVSGVRYFSAQSRLYTGEDSGGNNRVMIFDGSTNSTPAQRDFIHGYE